MSVINSVINALPVTNGGTGQDVIFTGAGGGGLNVDQLVQADTTSTLSNVSMTANSSFVVSNGTIWTQTITAPYIVLPLTDVTGISQTMAPGNIYMADNASLVTLTLPTSCLAGSYIQVVGFGAGGWLVAQNANQKIHSVNSTTTTGITGTVASTTSRYASIELLCVVADLEWTIISSSGVFTLV